MADEPRLHLLLDRPISRRKRWSHVATEEGDLLYSAAKVSDVWQFIATRDEKIIHVDTGKGTIVVRIERLLPW